MAEIVTAPRDPIYHLQRMLSEISRQDSSVSPVTPNGIYTEQTERSVRSFQISRGLPATGEADAETFDRIVDEYITKQENAVRSGAIYPFERQLSGNRLFPGECCELVMLLQIMLETVSVNNDNIVVTSFHGVYDKETENNVMAFQKSAGLQETGVVDLQTWNRLADVYNDSLDPN